MVPRSLTWLFGKIFRGTFSVLTSEQDGFQAIAVIDSRVQNYAERSEFPFLLTATAPYHSTDGGHMPTREEGEALETWEAAIVGAMGASGPYFFVGRTTWNLRRELLFYVPTLERDTVLNELLQRSHPRPFSVQVTRDEEWRMANRWFPQ